MDLFGRGNAEKLPLTELPQSISVDQLGTLLGVRRFHVMILLAGLIIQMPSFAIQIPTGWVLGDFKKQFGLAESTAAMLGTSVTMGSAVGVCLGGFAADCIGRKQSMIIINIWVAVLSFGHFLLADFKSIVLLRFTLGIAYGGNLVICIPYIMEFVSDKFRGRAACFVCLSYPICSMFVVGYIQLLVPDRDWRIVYSTVPCIPAALSLLCLSAMPESPRWLLTSGSKKEAQEALDRVFQSPPIFGYARVGKAPDVRLPQEEDSSEVSLIQAVAVIFKPPLWYRFLICSTLYTVHSGVCNAFGIWSIEFYQSQKHYSVPMQVAHLSQLAAVTATVLSILLVDIIGRRVMLVIGFILCAMVLYLQTIQMPIIGSLTFLVVLEFSSTIVWVVLGIFMPEIFPTQIRGTALGLTSFLGRIASVVLPSVFGLYLPSAAYPVIRVLVCGWLFAAGVSMMIPFETSQTSLQDGIRKAGCLQNGNRGKKSFDDVALQEVDEIEVRS